MWGKQEGVKLQDVGHIKTGNDVSASKQRIDLNDLLRRASKQKSEEKRNNIIIFAGVLLVAVTGLLILNFWFINKITIDSILKRSK